MAKNYKQIVEDAKEQSTVARESSARHAHDLADMRKVATDAAESAQVGGKRQRKREQFNETASRNASLRNS